ncbi:hypothetical protein Nepgr_021006 [Nepenthes gracilis]|uniref:Methyltransferase n=1 Tax=Nepenthes gracilis TaxID=150966 RepID=A0AAD3SXX5_NEPGR|nr:hypothetical protein Nepgr_021006 [Nepenthes gracilis]
MAMTMTMKTLFQERKYPFIFTLSFLIICVILLLISTSQTQNYFSFNRPIHSNSSLSSSPPPQRPPTLIDAPDIRGAKNQPPSSIKIDEGLIPHSPSSKPHLQEEDRLSSASKGNSLKLKWEVCRGPAAVDYIPCLDNFKAIKALKSRRHMEHRERHCPKSSPRCLVPLPHGYKTPMPWPKSRDMIWFDNVPHPKLVEYKKDQNWVRKSGNYLVFPGGGTQFKEGVTKYITFIEKTSPNIKWGKNIRVVLDVGCGVASFGGYLLDRDVITMSFAPKDEHEAQIQFALERGIPATLSVIGTQKLIFPDNSYDLIHCARCRVHWDADGGRPLIELNRILRPGGFYIWSATPVYRNDERDQSVWKAMVALTKAMCWKVVANTVDATGIGLVIYQKPDSSSCYKQRKQNNPAMCNEDSRNISWYTPLGRCLPRLPLNGNWPPSWPERLSTIPISLLEEPTAQEMFVSDTKHWSALVSETYKNGLPINWLSVRNVMDMNAHYGGFASALVHDPLWVMNVIPVHEPDTLHVIFDRGLIGIYHDWCESFNTYPRTYDLLHSSFLFSKLSKRCDIVNVAVEMDRIVRPGRWIIVQDDKELIGELSAIFSSLHWSVSLHEGRYLVGKKGFWRPDRGNNRR